MIYAKQCPTIQQFFPSSGLSNPHHRKEVEAWWHKTIKIPLIFISSAGIFVSREFLFEDTNEAAPWPSALRPQDLFPMCSGKRQVFASKFKKIQEMSLSWFCYKSFSNLQVSHCPLIFCVPTGTEAFRVHRPFTENTITVYLFGCTRSRLPHMGSSSPTRDRTPGSLHWECGVLAAGSPRKAPFNNIDWGPTMYQSLL